MVLVFQVWVLGWTHTNLANQGQATLRRKYTRMGTKTENERGIPQRFEGEPPKTQKPTLNTADPAFTELPR